MSEEMLFRIMVVILSLVLLIVVVIILAEIIAHRKDADTKRFRQKLQYMRPYNDGYLYMDNPEMNKAMQIMHITSDFIEYSDTGIDGKYHRIWEF